MNSHGFDPGQGASPGIDLWESEQMALPLVTAAGAEAQVAQLGRVCSWVDLGPKLSGCRETNGFSMVNHGFTKSTFGDPYIQPVDLYPTSGCPTAVDPTMTRGLASGELRLYYAELAHVAGEGPWGVAPEVTTVSCL